MIVVERTAPLLTVQDRGRFGFLADGITRSGPLDALAHDVANALVGNSLRAAVFEGCLGGAQLRFERETMFAITGAATDVTLDGTPIASYVVHSARAGSVVVVGRLTSGAVWYFAPRGGIDTPLVLGSRATLLSAELGGRAIRNGSQFAYAADVRATPVLRPVPPELRPAPGDRVLPLCTAPRADALDAAQWQRFYGAEFKVTHAVSRTGYRLEGLPLENRLAADLASEPACAGAMQLPPEGQPIVLMADHPTIGGYPVIGVVPSHALGRLAQCPPGTMVTFTPMTADAARDARIRKQNALSKWASGE
jgi:biotin-dependent carboxylase-like uncharacterized protein